MRGYVVKPERDEDFYVIWSDNVEAPLAYGPREYVLPLLDSRQQTVENSAEARFQRADENGSSALWPSRSDPIYGWDDDTFIYQQQSILHRTDLKELCQRLGETDHAAVCDLLTAFEDDWPVRHDEGCRCPATEEKPRPATGSAE